MAAAELGLGPLGRQLANSDERRLLSQLATAIQPGTFLRVRSKLWIIEDARTVHGLSVLDLVSTEDDSQGEVLSLALEPEVGAEIFDPTDWSPLLQTSFDNPERLGAYLKATEWRTASAADRRLFQAPFGAGIRLDAYQLLPLAKALELPRVNLLIADDVGLGKTIEAGLIVRELLLRRRVDVVVVSASASMLLQWQDELAQKFGLDFAIVDREHLLETRRTRGFAANPWSIGSRFIVSHSVLADEAYIGGLRDLLGEFRARSMFILDEAHHAAPSSGRAWAIESQMTRAVREIARRFEHRLFLSATPHNGTRIPSPRCCRSSTRSASRAASTSRPRSSSRSWSDGSRRISVSSGSPLPGAASSRSASQA
jgi:SNF2 family DNA or RNA helicase